MTSVILNTYIKESHFSFSIDCSISLQAFTRGLGHVNIDFVK